MHSLRISLLGSPRIQSNDQAVTIHRRKALALLIYLAVTKQPHTRNNLATLFWPEHDQTGARANLRRTLHMVRKAIDENWLEVSRQQIEFNFEKEGVWVDVFNFQKLLDAVQTHQHDENQLCSDCVANLSDAVALYKGSFLEGFTIDGTAEFDEWQYYTTHELQQSFGFALERLARHFEQIAEFEAALPFARRLLLLDTLNEAAHRRIMRLYALIGNYSAAARQYQICAKTLETELGVEPDEDTSGLLAAIEAKEIGAPRPVEPTLAEPSVQTEAVAAPVRHNLPTFSDLFVGRQKELEQIEAYLLTPTCRLLTLRGLGGMGKTRLAVESVWRLVAKTAVFADGLFFINLASVEDESNIAHTIAETLNLTLPQSTEPLEQLIKQIHNKNMLLLLDNFEHLQNFAPRLIHLLQQCSELTLFVTSRHQLNLSGETVLALDGLSLQTGKKGNAATQLFEERARQFVPNLDVGRERPFINAICNLVGGMPLAIELCSAWINTLSSQEILAEIQQGLDLLEGDKADRPDRHLSIRAVFQTSFNHLTPAEQKILATLALFPGGFNRPSAQDVAGARLTHLRAFVGKSLLRAFETNAKTRYQMHTLLRQFALEKLAPQQLDAGYQQLAAYFSSQLKQLGDKRHTAENNLVIQTVTTEIDNLRAVWQWLSGQIKANHVPDLICQHIQALMPAWYYVYIHKSLILDGKNTIRTIWQAMLENAWETEGTAQQQDTFALITAVLSDFCMELSQFDDVYRLSQRAIATFQQQENLNRDYLSLAFRAQGKVQIRTGNLAEAEQALKNSLAYANDDMSIGLVKANLGTLSSDRGDYDTALQYYSEAVASFEKCHDQSLVLKVATNIAAVYGRQELYDEAIPRYEQVVKVARQAGEKRVLLVTLNNLAFCLSEVKKISKVEAYYDEALHLSTELGNKRWRAILNQNLGEHLLQQGDTEPGKQYIQAGLELAVELDSTPDVLGGIVPMALWQAQIGYFDKALAAVGFVKDNKIARADDCKKASDFWDELATELPDVFSQRAKARLEFMTLDDVLEMLLS